MNYSGNYVFRLVLSDLGVRVNNGSQIVIIVEDWDMRLTLSEANKMVAAAIAEAERTGIKLSVSVCDAGGHLLAFNRMEGAIFISAVAAQGKAVGAVGFGRDSSAIPGDNPVIQAIMATQGGKIIPAQGALPIVRDGEIIGAIGGSGGTAQQDEDCARVGLAAL